MQLNSIQLPELTRLEPEPRLTAAIYESRLARMRQAMGRSGLDAGLVYADREHFANIAYLTGFDPRFEEALLVVRQEGDPSILTGNEDLSFCEKAGVPVRGVLCQSFSLPGQDRSIQPRIADGLAEAGLRRDASVGLVGWKPIPQDDAPEATPAFAVPQFVVSALQGYLERPLADATPILSGPSGVRALNEADQLALQEHRSTRASGAVWRAVEALAPEKTELEVSAAMGLVGLPLSAHVMCTSGESGVNGLSSPTDRAISAGGWFSTAVGYWGGLCCRAGAVREADDPFVAEFVDRFAGPYYAAVRAWYGALRIGASGGEVSRVVQDVLAPTAVETMLDAGHLIHLDEWLDTPFGPGRADVLASGMAIQADIIPVSDRFADDRANVEDGIAVADADLRAELRERYPDAWARIEARRAFMADVLGIELADEVLPFSDRQGVFAPALLSPNAALIP